MRIVIGYGRGIVKLVKIWTNGCFDVLHRGHIELFKYAKSIGDELMVGVDSDNKIKRDKGFHRPINKLEDRIEILKSIRYIDKIVYFYSNDELEYLIKNYKPDIIVVGSDWKGKGVVGEKYTDEVKFFDRIKGYSTTRIINDAKMMFR
jgi:rfaE bifunctional protein nucleotidyltransferase chain/domain